MPCFSLSHFTISPCLPNPLARARAIHSEIFCPVAASMFLPMLAVASATDAIDLLPVSALRMQSRSAFQSTIIDLRQCIFGYMTRVSYIFMKSQRLLEILLRLQGRSPRLASELARSLNVAERTIYRDI